MAGNSSPTDCRWQSGREPESVDLDDLARAEGEASEAQALVRALEERVANGDTSVSPEEVEAKQSLSRFAQLRLRATEAKLNEARHALSSEAATGAGDHA